MKTIIFILLISLSALPCKNWISKAEAIKSINKVPNAGAIPPREGEEKFCFDGINMAFAKIEQIEVDDTSKPIYEAKSNVQACEGQADCFEKKDKEYCSDIENVEGETVNVCTSYCGQFGSGLIAFIDENYSEVYCTKIIGYKQKKIDKLVEDKELRAKFEKEKSDKEAAKEAAKLILKDCKKDDKFDKKCFQKLLEYLEL